LAALDELHAEVALTIPLTNLVNRNNAWVFEPGSSFRFAAKALQVRFGGPRAKADHFERDGAIKTFLMGAINYALTASADFLQQFVVAKVCEHSNRMRGFLFNCYSHAIITAGLSDKAGF
jgi:hypothetical protein